VSHTSIYFVLHQKKVGTTSIFILTFHNAKNLVYVWFYSDANWFWKKL